MDYTERTCIIVVEMQDQGGTVHMGIVVDPVSEVLNIKVRTSRTPPLSGQLNTDYILGMAKMGKA